ncbi:MAG: diguanylate phosphodiesterase, partial [Solibacillus sp.]
MGVLEMLDKLDQIETLYEPIYSADGHRVVAYEVIGQLDDSGTIVDIEQFTYEEDVPEDIRFEIELLFVRKTIEAVKHLLVDVNLYMP